MATGRQVRIVVWGCVAVAVIAFWINYWDRSRVDHLTMPLSDAGAFTLKAVLSDGLVPPTNSQQQSAASGLNALQAWLRLNAGLTLAQRTDVLFTDARHCAWAPP